MTESNTSKLGKLRAIRTDELTLMLSWRNAPNVRMNMYTQHEISQAEHLAWWARIQARTDQQYFMYEFQGKPLGIVAFNAIDHYSRNAVWAFYASPDAPNGTGSKMEYLAIEYAFTVIKLHKLFCEVLEFNPTVIKLHKKFGFEVEGVFREHYKINDIFYSIYRLRIFASEWDEKRKPMLIKLLRLLSN